MVLLPPFKRFMVGLELLSLQWLGVRTAPGAAGIEREYRYQVPQKTRQHISHNCS
ncbi:hypothetical protein ACJ2A9_17855 [Anaerobacillus sp. MEB173]|uniref:hypothetical protein n=1 Tax=Anaerobacillus sp. MEB173 TaxID=3383345 RepID=UPI003F93053D